MIRELEAIAVLQAAIKKTAMVFNYEAKLRVAAYYGLTFEQVDLPYAEWAALHERYTRERSESK
jgi:hypothetical protein